jgi:hypothetical protein
LCHPDIETALILGFETADASLKLMNLVQECAERSSVELAKRNEEIQKLTQKNKKLPPPPPSASADKITLECEYYDKRTVVLSKNNLTYEIFVNQIRATFDVPALTIMHRDIFLESQAELDALLRDGKSSYDIALYDPYQ